MRRITATKWLEKLQRPKDLPSFNMTLSSHIQNIGNMVKYYRTEDSQTIKIIDELVSDNPFLKENITSKLETRSNNETASIRVEVCDMENHPELKMEYEKWKDLKRSRIVNIGGPAAVDQTLLSLLVPGISQKADVHYYNRSFKESNLMYSGLQSHARDAHAVNERPELTGRKLLPILLKRLFTRDKVGDIFRNSNYLKLNVNFTNFKYFPVYIMNELHGLQQNLKLLFGRTDEHTTNRLESVVSQQLLKIMEDESGVKIVMNHNKDLKKSMALSVVYNLEGAQLEKCKQQQSHFFNKTKQIIWQEMPLQEFKALFPQANEVSAAWRFRGDHTVYLDAHQKIKNRAIELGATWKEDKTLRRVYVKKDPLSGKLVTCGVSFSDGEFVPADKVHLTLGYKADYFYEGTEKRCLKNIVVPATGVSSHIILRRTQEIDKIIRQNGSLELSSTIGHLTAMTWNDEYVLARASGGGNLGYEGYMADHALVIFSNMRRVFGSAFVGIYDVYGCSRSVNYKNTTQFAQIADGLVISYGKGGTGNTKRTSEAYKALKYMGYGEELKKFISSKKVDHFDDKLHETVEHICKQTEKTNLFYDRQRHVRRNLF